MNFDSTSGVTALLPRFLCFTDAISYLIKTRDYPILIAGDTIITNDCLALDVSSGTSSSNQEKEQETVELL